MRRPSALCLSIIVVLAWAPAVAAPSRLGQRWRAVKRASVSLRQAVFGRAATPAARPASTPGLATSAPRPVALQASNKRSGPASWLRALRRPHPRLRCKDSLSPALVIGGSVLISGGLTALGAAFVAGGLAHLPNIVEHGRRPLRLDRVESVAPALLVGGAIMLAGGYVALGAVAMGAGLLRVSDRLDRYRVPLTNRLTRLWREGQAGGSRAAPQH